MSNRHEQCVKRSGLKPYLISGNKFKSMFEIVCIFAVEDIESPDQVLDAELQVVAATSTATPDQAFLIHFADLWINDKLQYLFYVKSVIQALLASYFNKT
jgi:hypothetical protein